jgi:two-component system, cell cycle sensor histidine kinase and response regulator CckA
MPTSSMNKAGIAGPTSQDELRGLIVAQKTELIGELAQATSNQFNNIMMAVTSYIELELKKAGGKDRSGLKQVLSQATRATSLIQKLLAFSRTHTPELQKLDFDAVIGEVSPLLKELLGEQVELNLRLKAGSEVLADRVDVEQTLFALVVIARKAMSGAADLTISTALTNLDREFIGSNEEAAPGEYVVLSVEHNTPAKSDPATATNLGQTQQVNLSLSAVRGIVKSSHGLARFSSVPGAGSSFKLYFPASTPEAVEDQTSTLPRNPAVARTILVVEDDDAVRVPAVEFLMMEGFKVLQARTGSEALSVVQQSRSALDILVTDIIMPKMNGCEVAAILLREHPELKVLYISGDPGRDALQGVNTVSPNTILRKPFRLNILRDKIHDLLGE